MQYDLASPLIDQLFQAPGSLAGAYKAVVIAVTCTGGCLILLCFVMALAFRRWDNSAGRPYLPNPPRVCLVMFSLLSVLVCICSGMMQPYMKIEAT